MVPLLLYNTDFFKWAQDQQDNQFDAIITDPPYTSFRNKIGESALRDNSFKIERFCEECFRLLKPDGIFVSFCSIHLLKDYFIYFRNKLKFRCEQIWDKRPTRNWISYAIPLRHLEYIAYFGGGKLDFRDGKIKRKYKRNQFGGDLRSTKKNQKKYAEGQYEQIINISLPKSNRKSGRNKKKLNYSLNKYIKKSNGLEEQISGNLKHPTQKPAEFSQYFQKILGNPNKVLDPCCGTGSLICTFGINAVGIDISKWDPVSFVPKKIEKYTTLNRYFLDIE